MGVLWNDRSTPLALNAANTAFSNNITLAWDFTARDAAHKDGVPWIYVGATSPTLLVSGTQTVTTVNGEPGIVAGGSSLIDYTNTTDYGMQTGTGDFTIGIRLTTPGTLPAGSLSREIFRLSGSAGTAFSIIMLENPGVGWYFTPTGSTVLPLGANDSAVFYPASTTIMVWLTRISNVVAVYTQNVTTQTAPVRRNPGGSAAGTLDGTWAARTLLNYNATTTTPAMQACTHWNVGHSLTNIGNIGKNFYDTQTNTAVVDAIVITSPAPSTTIAATSVISGTYAGTAPSSGVEVQFGANAWVAGTGMTVSGGTWSGTFALTTGGPSTIQAREVRDNAVLSSTVASITVSADAIAFAGNGLTTDEAVAFRTFPANGSNQAVVRLKGTYTGSPSAIEYSYDGAAWATLVASPSGGVFDQTATLTGPAQGSLSVRFANNTAVVGTLSAVGVGRVIGACGQSQHVGGGAGTYVPAVAPGAHPTWKPSILDKTGLWRENVETVTDPFSKTTNASIYGAATATYTVQATSPNAYNSYFGKLATLYMASGIPAAFVPSAIGSTTIQNWAPSISTATLFGAMRARALTIGFVDITMWQGEANCGDGTTRAQHETALNAFVDGWKGYFPTAKIYLMNINATGNSAGTGGTGSSDTGFNAIHAAIANVAATNANVTGYADMNGAFSSGLHYSTAPEIDAVAARAFNAMTITAVTCAASWTEGSESVSVAGTSVPPSTSSSASWSEGSETIGIAATFAEPGSTTCTAGWVESSEIVAAVISAQGAFSVSAAWVEGSETSIINLLGDTTFARAPAGDGYRPRSQWRHSRPRAIQGYRSR